VPLLVNLRQLEAGPVTLKGELTPEELELLDLDELIQLDGPVSHDLTVTKMEQSVLVQGRLALKLRCECARCLKPFTRRLELADWTCHLLLEGDEAVKIVNDCADLTPLIREDILLELPQRPLCQPGCRGLPKKGPGKTKITGKAGPPGEVLPEWAVLNKLKL
jgi:uncharacterized protein